MIILGISKETFNCVYTYDDKESRNLSLEDAYFFLQSNNYKLKKNVFNKHTIIEKVNENEIYYFFFDKLHNVKDANHQAKILLAGIKKWAEIYEEKNKSYRSVNDVVWHNTKNLLHSTIRTMHELIDYDNLKESKDKQKFIQELIYNQSNKTSHLLLACSRSLEHLQREYDVISNLLPGVKLQENQLNSVKVHSLLVSANYMHEQAFKDKSLTVHICRTQAEILCHYVTLSSAFSYILENCVKYCKPNSQIDIETVTSNGNLKIDVTMDSLYNSDEDISVMFEEGKRGTEAHKKDTGDGIGLFVAKSFFQLNGMEIKFKRMEEKIKEIEGIKYCKNIFIIDIPKDIVIS